jgi:hypothetical protein
VSDTSETSEPREAIAQAGETSEPSELSELQRLDLQVPSDVSELSDTKKLDRLRVEGSEPSELSEIEKASPGEAEQPTLSDLSELSDIRSPSAWRNEVIHIVREEIRAAMASVQTFQTFQTTDVELPPSPEKVPGKHDRPVALGHRDKLGGTVDRNLVRAFKRWLRQRKLTISQGLDVALWHFLGKPKLSFETSETSDQLRGADQAD